jgi:hypothetical protein
VICSFCNRIRSHFSGFTCDHWTGRASPTEYLSLVADVVYLSRILHSKTSSGTEAVGRSLASDGKLFVQTFARHHNDSRWRTIP